MTKLGIALRKIRLDGQELLKDMAAKAGVAHRFQIDSCAASLDRAFHNKV